MTNSTTATRRGGFTLIELMVVIAIIGLLVAVLLPAFSNVRTQAAVLKATAQFNAISTGIEMYRSERALGGGYPPSASDDPTDRRKIANPQRLRGANEGQADVLITGAHLLAQAMIGAGGLGPPGFKDVNRNGRWSDDTHDEVGGIYEIDLTTGKEKFQRYGSGGFVDDTLRAQARPLQSLVDTGTIPRVDPSTPTEFAWDEPVFMDPWDHPILYYRANPSSLRMVGDGTIRGTFDQEDNGLITGTSGGKNNNEGLDFGPGEVDGFNHAIAVATSPAPTDNIQTAIIDQSDTVGQTYFASFAVYVLDPATKGRPTAVNRKKYLLISAGPDGRYGTEDDVTNWDREVE